MMKLSSQLITPQALLPSHASRGKMLTMGVMEQEICPSAEFQLKSLAMESFCERKVDGIGRGLARKASVQPRPLAPSV